MFGPALKVPDIRSDLYVLGEIADEMDVHLGLPDAGVGAGRDRPDRHLAREAETAPAVPAGVPIAAGPGEAILATWHLRLDDGRMQDGEPYLAGTARAGHRGMSTCTAAEAGVSDGEKVTVATARGSDPAR